MHGILFVLAIIAAERTVTVEVPQPELHPAGDLFEIIVPGMISTDEENFSPVPRQYFFYPVPPGSAPSLEWAVESTGETGWGEETPLSSAPVIEGRDLRTAVSRSPALIPPGHQPVSMEVVHLLGSTVAVIEVSPFCYGSPSAYAREITFSLSHPDAPGGRPVEGTLFEHLSPEAELWWPYRERSPDSPFWGKPWARIRINADGFYSVSCSELEESGCMVSGSPSASLAMYSGPGEMFDPENPSDSHGLIPVAVSVHDGEDGIFDSSDSLVFYGRSLWHWNFTPDTLYRSPHRYDDAGTYWLTWGSGNGKRIAAAETEPSGGFPVEEGIVSFGFEEEVLSSYDDNRTGWIWGFIFENTPGYFYLGSPFQSDLATLRFAILKSGTYPWEHNLVAELDGTTVLDTLVTASMRHETYSIEGVAVSSGGNMLKLWSDWHGTTFLDYAELLVPVDLSTSSGYPVYIPGIPPGLVDIEVGSVSSGARIFDLADPFAPVELVNWELEGARASISFDPDSGFAVLLAVEPEDMKEVHSIQSAQPGRILGTSSRGDVLVTLPEEFLEAAQILQPIYSSRNRSVFFATYREIYDEFGQGVSDPGAVRSFVRWALDTWSDPPGALLIIGDGSDDPLGYSTGYRTNSPVYRELVSGNCYESFFTAVHDGMTMPEIPVSRIPASSVNELAVALQKSYQMELGAIVGPWQNTVILAADDEWGADPGQYKEDHHTLTCELIADSVLPQSLSIVKHYLIEYPWPPGTTPGGAHPEKPEAARDLIGLLNTGASSFTFFGHGSYDQMASEKLMSSGMVTQLTNAPRFFLYNSFSCNNGEFCLSAGDCLAEILLFHPQGGAAVAMACTGGSFFTQNSNLSSMFMGYLYGEEQLSAADAFWLSTVTLQYLKNLEYCVLGDGGIVIPMGHDDLCETAPPDSLFRGQMNTVGVQFLRETSFLFRCRESADTVTYVSPLSEGFSIDYLRYGSPIYTGVNATDANGSAEVGFFVPLQADTGSMGRIDATGAAGGILGTGYSWPVRVSDNGNYTDDTEGPHIELSFKDAQPGDVPSVYQNAVLTAALSDDSGICVLGNDAGSIIICSIDGEYEDVTDLFLFNTGSSTAGTLEYFIPDLLPGEHQVRVVARDGMKNTGEGILDFNVLHGEPPLLEETGVFPNPSRGTRAFFFTTGSAGTVEAGVFTIAGRPVWTGEKTVSPGTDQIVWNGLDADGDPLSAGTYIYNLKFNGGSGSASVTDLLVVSP